MMLLDDDIPPHSDDDVPADREALTTPVSSLNQPTTTPSRHIVEWYYANGFDPVFWKANGDSKGPHESGWPGKTYTPSDYQEGYRAGLKTGVELSPGKFFHDIDIDWAAGAQIALALLPATAFLYGRASKRISHCGYTLPEALPSFKYIDPSDQSTLIELRGTTLDGTIGCQSMAPPSVWSKDGKREPLNFVRMRPPDYLDDARLLTQPTTHSAIAMVLARHLGQKGFGHEQRLAWAGFLLRTGLSKEECVAIGNAILLYTGNKDKTDIKLAVESTAKSLDADGKKVQGGPALAKMLGAHGPAIIARILEWLGKSQPVADLIVRKATDVPDERLEKTYGGRLIRGSIALLAGPGEGGKGMWIGDTIARLTTGAPFPNETRRRTPMNVLVCVTEDSAARVKSRLRTAGADLDRVYFVEGPEIKRGGLTMPSPMLLDDDAGALVRHAKQVDARALFLETVVEHFGDRSGKTRRSTNNEADVRSALAPFRAACALGGLYGVGVIHPRKSVEGSVDDSISGSAAFRNVARAAHHIYRDPDDESDDPVRLLFSSKTNYLARRPPTLRFRIVGWDEVLGAPCTCMAAECDHEGRIIWDDEPVDARTAEEVWQAIAERNRARRDVAVEKGEEFLIALMANGVINMTPKEIFKRASDEGLSKAAITRAKERLKLISVKNTEFPASVIGWAEKKEDF